MTQENILMLKNISKTFPGTKALKGVSLEVKKGEVHGLMGENGAGKSTLVNIISGVFPPDPDGEIVLDGNRVEDLNPLQAQKLGVGFVHQEISLCPHMSVAENIFIGRLPKNKLGFVDYETLNNDCLELLKRFHNDDIKPTAAAGSLNMAQQQLVEIARALSYNLKLLILDEPTSSLTEKETVELFKIIRELKQSGISIIYISHRMAEIFEICDRLTVLKDGQYVDSVRVQDIDSDTIVSMMVGRSIGSYYPPKSTKDPGNEILQVKGFSGHGYHDIDFELKSGEILGFVGLIGSGRSELMRGLCGIDKHTAGQVVFFGEEAHIPNYKKAIRMGLVYMTEDRKQEGLFLDRDIKSNVSASIIDRLTRHMFIKDKEEDALCHEYIQSLAIKVTGPKQLCNSLSGGNQQKVLMAKSLAIKPRLLIVDEPTRGIDVNVKTEIYKLLRNLCDEGIGVIVISSELPEAIGLCDRIAVMRGGEISAFINSAEMTEEYIMSYAATV